MCYGKEFILKWKKENNYYMKKMNRELVIHTFEKIIDMYSYNNRVSKELTKIIPIATEVKINWDSTADINQLYYVIDGKLNGLPIINAHFIVWTVWKTYCNKGEKIKPEEF